MEYDDYVKIARTGDVLLSSGDDQASRGAAKGSLLQWIFKVIFSDHMSVSYTHLTLPTKA